MKKLIIVASLLFAVACTEKKPPTYVIDSFECTRVHKEKCVCIGLNAFKGHGFNISCTRLDELIKEKAAVPKKEK